MMRSTGVIGDLRALGRHDHVCWTYTDPDDLRNAACDFLADGLAHGERVAFITPDDVAAMREALGGLGDLEAHLGTGASSSSRRRTCIRTTA